MVIGAWGTELPVKFAVGFANFDVIDTGMSVRHQPVAIKFPILVAIGAVPLAFERLEFVAVARRDAIFSKGPQLFDEAVIEFPQPLIFQEFDDLLAALEKGIAVAPRAVWGIRQRYLFWFLSIPGILCRTYFEDR